jgi:E3 ubiquitin-protein ligase MARCH6
MEAPVIEGEEAEEEEEEGEVDVDVLLDAHPPPPQQQNEQLRRPPLVAENRFDSFFDVQWEDHEGERPPSPIAPMWYNNDASTSSSGDSSFAFNSNDKFQQRAASMPPTLSRSTSFRSEEEQDAYDTFNLRVGEGVSRAASMEPDISYHNQAAESSAFIHRGHPPHAPRMRHAEASIPLIRPAIIEEEEEDEELIAAQGQVDIILDQQQQQVINPPPPPPQPAQAVADNDLIDDDENIEEFEGVLEAIGMNGSIWSLMQNSALMGLLIALSLGAAVWMPYLIGMLFIMTETLDLIRIPLKLTRLITDPLIDFLFMVCTDYIWPFLVENYQQYIASTKVFEKVSIATMYIFNYIKDHGLLFADSSHTTLSDTLNTANNNGTMMHHSIQYMTKWINETEPLLETAFNRYQALATGQTAMDRFACIAVGYMIVIFLSSWYLTRATHNNLANAAFGRTAQEAIRHQGIIFKVGMFITIELILFPIVCGFLLDFSTMPLFKQASLLGRLAYLRSHPVPSIFLHWFLGTGFMFLFAVLVTICRDIVRPGVMWFIRDPNDPQFHPIREIVERPVFFQFKKIGASAIIYLTVILVGVGGVVHCINTVASQILPLRWSLS